ncbi:hypothetical protein DEAC_c43730 [Desulfosporosinus acididurans]|uniref:Zinc-ribbon domain-containing protein n=1 Tax=Desulfosporosinus acididurans TaxID=476652 RepID=A0A0J1FJV4_9FIRM|nr:zinc-ribbon domain-containing protein [Desulfosporosinus acididurans]KLU63712.1 hypothetical protein DEAC_c43730 [Desulfosporosinus acididurans]
MFCGNCGQEVTSQDKFCGSCGAPVPQDIQGGDILEGESTASKKDFIPESVARELETANQEISATVEMPIPREVVVKAPMSKKTKIIIGTIAVIAVALYGGYQYARSKFTVTSPYLLEQKFTTALKSQDMATLSSLLDSDSGDLKSADSLAAFKASLTDNVTAAYLQQLQQEVDHVPNSSAFGSNADRGWLTLKKTSSWLGNSWKVHVASVGVVTKPIPQDNVSFSIGNLKSANGEVAHLWPSAYAFTGTVTNDYAKEDVKGNVSFLDQLGSIHDFGAYDYNLDLSSYLKTSLNLVPPDNISNLQVLINNKPITIPSNGLTLSPAPTSGTIELKGDVSGVSIDEKETTDFQNLDLTMLMNRGIAKHSLIGMGSDQSNISGDSAQTQVEDVIMNYYQNIPSNMTLAYSYLSNEYQQQLPFESWKQEFPNTISDSVGNVYVTSINGNEATASFTMTSRDSTNNGGTLVRKWEGQWNLVFENGQWKLNQPQIKMDSENNE